VAPSTRLTSTDHEQASTEPFLDLDDAARSTAVRVADFFPTSDGPAERNCTHRRQSLLMETRLGIFRWDQATDWQPTPYRGVGEGHAPPAIMDAA
jgi:hypothetical protein